MHARMRDSRPSSWVCCLHRPVDDRNRTREREISEKLWFDVFVFYVDIEVGLRRSATVVFVVVKVDVAATGCGPLGVICLTK